MSMPSVFFTQRKNQLNAKPRRAVKLHNMLQGAYLADTDTFADAINQCPLSVFHGCRVDFVVIIKASQWPACAPCSQHPGPCLLVSFSQYLFQQFISHPVPYSFRHRIVLSGGLKRRLKLLTVVLGSKDLQEDQLQR